MSAPSGGQGSPAPAGSSPNATVGSVHSPQPLGAIPPKASSKAGPKVKKPAPKRKR